MSAKRVSPGLRLHLDAPAHAPRELVGDRETQAAALRRGVRCAVEALEEPGLIGRRDARAVVADLEPRQAVDLLDRDHDPAPGRRMAQRVVEQRAQHLADTGIVSARVHLAVREHRGDRRPAAGSDTAQLAHAVLGDPGQLDVLVRDGDSPGVQAREVEQVGRELGETIDLLAHRREEAVTRLGVGIVLGGELEEAAERGERRPQLVRGVRDERPACILEPAELDAHHVQRAGEVRDLVAARVDDRLVERARGEALGRALQPSQAACQGVRPHDREQGGGEQGDRAGGQDASLDQ